MLAVNRPDVVGALFAEPQVVLTAVRPHIHRMINWTTCSERSSGSVVSTGGRRLEPGPVTLSPSQLPAITVESALFLDFDGTLADLTACPENVRVHPATATAIASLQRHLAGALAIVTGRTIADLDRRLAPLRVKAAGMHGAELRLGDDAIALDPRLPPRASEALAAIAETLRPTVAQHPGLQLEHKPLALSLHYRRGPEHAGLCWEAAQAATRSMTGFEVRPGKMVVEIVPATSNKGTAIRCLMASAPFKGRRPLFAGDDAADEAAIEAVQSMGGAGIRIVDEPDTPTCAYFRVPAATLVRNWLARSSTMR